MLTAAKEELLSARCDPGVFFPSCPEPAEWVAAFEGVPENSHQGMTSKNPALHRGWNEVNSTTALGMEPVLRWEGIKPRSSPYGSGSCGGMANGFIGGIDDAIEIGFTIRVLVTAFAYLASRWAISNIHTHPITIPSPTTAPWYASKGGTQEVGHDYVRDMARAKPGDYCSNLKKIMDNARNTGNSKLFNDAKATWKQDCRGR